jgi:hypothetical protein
MLEQKIALKWSTTSSDVIRLSNKIIFMPQRGNHFGFVSEFGFVSYHPLNAI